MTRTVATAKVIVLLEIDLGSTWGTDCTVGQVDEQARQAADAKMTRALGDAHGIRIATIQDVVISFKVTP